MIEFYLFTALVAAIVVLVVCGARSSNDGFWRLQSDGRCGAGTLWFVGHHYGNQGLFGLFGENSALFVPT